MAQGLFHPNCRHGCSTHDPRDDDDDYDEAQRTDSQTEALKEESAYAQRMVQKYKRLSAGSLDPGNIARYSAKLREWEEREAELDVAISEKSGIMNGNIGSDNVTGFKTLGKIDAQPLESEFGKLLTDEIVVTNERVEHIKARHPEDFSLFEIYGADAVKSPDLIIADSKNSNTVFMVKKLDVTNLNVVVKLVLESSNPKLKNSVMTFYRIRDKNLKKLINKNKTLYKKE